MLISLWYQAIFCFSTYWVVGRSQRCVIHGKLEASHIITRLEDLFGLVFKEFPIIICLDDFEQNLIRKGDLWQVKQEYLATVEALLTSLPWSDGNALLMMTSRYPFVFEKRGVNLAETLLEQIPLSSFRGADLRKKQKQLPGIDKSAHLKLYMEIGNGNPRLLEWLDEIAAREKEFDFTG